VVDLEIVTILPDYVCIALVTKVISRPEAPYRERCHVMCNETLT